MTDILETLEQKGRNVCRLRAELSEAERDIAETFAKAQADGAISSFGDLSAFAFRAVKRPLVESAKKRLAKGVQ